MAKNCCKDVDYLVFGTIINLLIVIYIVVKPKTTRISWHADHRRDRHGHRRGRHGHHLDRAHRGRTDRSCGLGGLGLKARRHNFRDQPRGLQTELDQKM